MIEKLCRKFKSLKRDFSGIKIAILEKMEARK